MRLIRAHCLGYAHEGAVKDILEHGLRRTTENGEITAESDIMHIEVYNPFEEPMISPYAPQKRKYCDEYARQIIYGTTGKFEYDYHKRLFNWCDISSLGNTRDQIGYIIDKLKKFPESRRAIAVTWIPPVDEDRDDVPCLQFLQCVIQNGKLNMMVLFRSNDMLSALGANMYGFAQLQHFIADAVNIPTGIYSHTSIVPHVYYVRDIHELKNMCLGMMKEGRAMYPLDDICEVCGGCIKGCRRR